MNGLVHGAWWRPGLRDGSAHTTLAITTAVLAGTVRLVPVLRGGGLTGLGNYDDGVYYATGTALLHGVLPYRDYLFLHPPGIVLLLAPFGLFGLAGHDPTGLAAARFAWMVLGMINTVLVARILRPIGLLEAAVGAVLYATAYPAIYIERTPLLEGPAQTCVLAAVLVLNRRERAGRPTMATAVLAGAMLGVSAAFKIWGVAAVAAVLVCLIVGRRWSTAAFVSAGAAAGAIVICLPFFLTAPFRMWQMVVLDQLGRHRDATSLSFRLADVAGRGLHRTSATFIVVGVVMMGFAVGALVAAVTVPAARLCVVLTIVLTVLLLASPSWFLHYPGLVTGPGVVSFAAGAGVIIRRLVRWRACAGWPLGVLVAGLVVWLTFPLTGLKFGRSFPADRFAGVTGPAAASCVTSDDPTVLVGLNVLSRNLDEGCRFVADLGGYSYQFAAERGRWIRRSRDRRWQQMYLSYLGSGRLSLPFRYAEHGALSRTTRAVIDTWPERARAGRYVLREPG